MGLMRKIQRIQKTQKIQRRGLKRITEEEKEIKKEFLIFF